MGVPTVSVKGPHDRQVVGREPELSTLAAAFADTVAGRARLLLLSGDPGIGKTRLAREAAERAAAEGALVAWGRCWEAGGAPEYWPWMQILQTLLTSAPKDLSQQWLGGCAATLAPLLPGTSKSTGGGMLAVSDSPSGRFDVFRCVATVLERASATRPILILFDDLHGADEPSLLLLEFIARQLAELPIMIVAAYRDVAMKARSPLCSGILSMPTTTAAIPSIMGTPASRVSLPMAGSRATRSAI